MKFEQKLVYEQNIMFLCFVITTLTEIKGGFSTFKHVEPNTFCMFLSETSHV